MSELDAGSVPGTGASEHDSLAGQLRRHLLLLRFTLFNIVAFALLTATALQGWLDGALASGTRWPSVIIFAVFLYGLVLCTVRVLRVDRDLDRLRRGLLPATGPAADYLRSAISAGNDLGAASGLLRLRLTHPGSTIRHVANALVFLGLIGTVVGFIVALSGVDPKLSSNVDTVAPMVATLITGMSIALYTTLIGAVLHIWLMICYRMLVSGNVAVFDAIVTYADQHVGG